jgi:tetratricopeptide (TPR) repeat protein/O-antigen ligase
LPVSLYGIMQHYRVDPLVWIRGGTYRVESTLGNPILIGAYLIMVVPLTGWQLVRSFSLIRSRGKKADFSLVLFGCYLLLLILQLICLVFTQSRGPLIGLMAGVFFSLLLLAVSKGWKGLALTTIGLAIGLGFFLIALNLPDTPLAPMRKMPFLARLGEISAHIRERTVIWEGAVEMITADPLKAVVGHGPDSMGLTFYSYLPPEWLYIAGSGLSADRCHNETLDAWVTGGLIGLVAYLALFGSIFYYGLKQLGLIANSRQRTFLIGIWLMGGFLGVLIPWLVEGSLKWVGLGIPAGLLLALVIYLMVALFQRGKREIRGGHNQILLIALLSAIVAHFVEIQFGIAITATRTYFWLYAALLAVIGHHWQRCPEPDEGPVEGEEPIPEAAAETLPPYSSGQRRSQRRRGKGQRVDRPLGVTSIPLSGSVLSHSLLVGLILATTGFDLINHQFDLRANGPVIFGLLFIVWVLGRTPILTSNLQSPISNFSTYVLGSLLCFFPFIAAHAAIVLPGAGVERANIVYYAYIFSIILAVAVALMIGSNLSLPLYRSRAWWLYPIIGIGALFLILNTNLKAAQADIYYKFALSSEETGDIDKAIALYGRAIQLTPRWDQYYSSLGWAYGLKAVTAADANQRTALFEESRKVLEHAQQMSPLDPDIMAKLGHIYWNWASLTPNLEQRAEKLEVALAHYRQAVTLSPLNHGYLLKDNIVQTYLHLGAIYTSLGKLSQAAEVYQKASEMAPDRYESHKNLALVYRQLGRLDEALEEAETARDLAPEEEKPGLDDLIAQLGTEKK